MERALLIGMPTLSDSPMIVLSGNLRCRPDAWESVNERAREDTNERRYRERILGETENAA
jgi:hypothetical protein